MALRINVKSLDSRSSALLALTLVFSFQSRLPCGRRLLHWSVALCLVFCF